MAVEVIVAIFGFLGVCVTAGLSALVTLKCHKASEKNAEQRAEAARIQADRNNASQTIINMITQDIISVEILHKMPENYTSIMEAYDEYHAEGGNGRITKRVNEYQEWLQHIHPEDDDLTLARK